jgi:hypothetical protein
MKSISFLTKRGAVHIRFHIEILISCESISQKWSDGEEVSIDGVAVFWGKPAVIEVGE